MRPQKIPSPLLEDYYGEPSIDSETVLDSSLSSNRKNCSPSSYVSSTPTLIKDYFRNGLALELFLCLVLFLLGFYLPRFCKTHERPIPYQVLSTGDVILDFSLNEKVVGEQIPEMTMLYIATIVPLVVILSLECYFKNGMIFHDGCCVYFSAMGVNALVTGFIKRFTGRLRPHFYEKCDFDTASLECKSDDYEHARMSFPSGHSSVSFCALTCVALVLLGVGRFIASMSTSTPSTSRTCLYGIHKLTSYCPIALATFISVTRIYDNFHFPSDVVAGALIGTVVAWNAYHIRFPSIYDDAEYGIPRRFLPGEFIA